MTAMYEHGLTEEQIRAKGKAMARKDTEAKTRISGITLAMILAAAGVLSLLLPGVTGIAYAFLITAGLGIYGITQIVSYIRTPAQKKNGWNLVNGILLTMFSAFSLISAATDPLGALPMIASLAFLVGFFTLSTGINEITLWTIFHSRKEPGAGWILARGIANVAVSFLMITNPVLGWFSMEWAWGILLLAGAASLFAAALTTGKHKEPEHMAY